MDELKELIAWFEKITGLRGVSLSTHMKTVDKMIKNKSAPFYWKNFQDHCAERTTEYHDGRNEWWKCNCEKHRYHLCETSICSFELCPLCPE